MKRSFKRFLSVFLALVMLLSLSTAAFAICLDDVSQSKSDIPVIRISGDGERLYDENGNKVIHYKDLFSSSGDDDDDDNSAVLEAIANVMMPFLLDGLLSDNWEPYYEHLQKEIGELFDASLLDENGDPKYGSGLSPELYEKMETIRHNDQAFYDSDGTKYYDHNAYWFNYDWRLDPIETAAEFKSFIDDILASTGCDQVGIIGTCLGTNIVTSYLALYPEHAKEHVRGVSYDGSVVAGAEMLSEVISGKFNVDAAAINRALNDCRAIDLFDVDGFVNTTLEMLDRTGVLDFVLGKSKQWIYYKIVEGATSALALSTFFTWPNYWACVSEDDFDTAMHYVFGDEGSKKRTEYAGLVAKLENYNTVVRQHISDILTSTVENGVHFGVISKYGYQVLPICESNDVVSDQFASVKRSSFGATTGTIYKDLPDKYIAERTAAVGEEYISPDGQIDASTCLFPESTWFIKGSSHSNWSHWEVRLLYEIASAKEQLTVNNSCWPSRFVVFTYPDTIWIEDGDIETMTTENCDTENWEADDQLDNPSSKAEKLFSALTSLIKWLLEIIQKLFKSA